MLTETFIAATEAVNKPSTNLSSALKDVGIFHYEFQPQNILRHGYKKTSVRPNSLAVSKSHIYASQANKAVIHVYSRDKGNQEATVAFPDKVHSLAYAREAAILVIGTEDGKLLLWEVATGRISTSTASHLEPVSNLVITPNNDLIISGSADSSIHVWSLTQLVSFSSPSPIYNDSAAKDAPLRTFAQHRAGIIALDVGHSQTNVNFAVSAAGDRTCYLWHIETCQILRTFLTPVMTTSLTLDPADRAIYMGNEDGTIQSIDLYGVSLKHAKKSIYDTTDTTPVQLTTKDLWASSSSDLGQVNCLTLSYDGTTLLSGHAGGFIMRWDAAKHRVTSEIANLNQPVSYVQMLVPDGLHHQDSRYSTSTVVKPRLELNVEATEGTLGLPASYTLLAQVVRGASLPGTSADVEDALSGGLFSDSMLDDAIQAMIAKSAGLSDTTAKAATTTSNKNDLYKIQSLEEEKAVLEKKLAVMQKLHNDEQERHHRRSERREEIGQQRREAYFAAKKNGKDGDEAMKPYEKKIEDINAESDDEEIRAGDQMELDD